MTLLNSGLLHITATVGNRFPPIPGTTLTIAPTAAPSALEALARREPDERTVAQR
jgi:hypothetical protein